MLAMLVIATATALAASNEDQFDSDHISKMFSEDDMTPDFAELFGSHDHTRDIKKRNDGTEHEKYEKYRPLQSEVRSTMKHPTETLLKNLTLRHTPEAKAPGRHVNQIALEDYEKRSHHTVHEDIDVVDREDHITQYLSDLLVNTDSEITSLQASDSEAERGDSEQVKTDWFFTFPTGQEKAVEVERAWSTPHNDDLQAPMIPDHQLKVIADVE